MSEAVQHRILQEATFYGLGIELLKNDGHVCPFCKRELTEADANHIRDHHASLAAKKQDANVLEQAQTELHRRISQRGALETVPSSKRH